MAKKKTDPYVEQAQAASLVRYGPELSALTALLHAAETSYSDRVRNAKSNRQFTVGAVDAAVPQVQQAYQGAQAAVQPAFAQGGGVEAQALTARLGESGALAQQQLAARRVSAVEGQGAAQQQALRDFRDDRGKIGDRSTALAQEIGAFTTQTSGELSAADASAQAESDKLAAQLGQSERNSIRSSGTDPDTGLPIPGGKLDPKTNAPKKKWVDLSTQGAAADDLDTARGFAEKLKAVGVSRGDAAQALLVGQDAKEIPVFQTVKLANGGTKQEKVLWRAGEKGNEDGSKTGTQKMQTISAVPQAKSKLLLQAALDQVYDGHLSRAAQRLLQARGIKIGPLGVTSFGDWLNTPEGQTWLKRKTRTTARPGNAVGANGQLRPT